MIDFEKGIRNAIQFVYPKVKILDYSFSFWKTIVDKSTKIIIAQKRTQTKKPSLNIIFKDINLYSPTEHEKYFQATKEIYIDDIEKYDQYLNYFQKNSLNKIISIAIPNDETEKSQQQDIFIRTNNACESFHSLLHSMIL